MCAYIRSNAHANPPHKLRETPQAGPPFRALVVAVKIFSLFLGGGQLTQSRPTSTNTMLNYNAVHGAVQIRRKPQSLEPTNAITEPQHSS